MNYADLIIAVATVGTLTISASMVAYHKISGGPAKQEVSVMVNDQDNRLDNIEKKLDEAVARQEIILKKLESVGATQDAYRVKRDED